MWASWRFMPFKMDQGMKRILIIGGDSFIAGQFIKKYVCGMQDIVFI